MNPSTLLTLIKYNSKLRRTLMFIGFFFEVSFFIASGVFMLESTKTSNIFFLIAIALALITGWIIREDGKAEARKGVVVQ